MIKAHKGGFVQIIQDLAVKAVIVDRDVAEIAFLFQRLHHLRHVELCSFGGEEDR
jgi:hypothetical protein